MSHCPYAALADLEPILAELRGWEAIREPSPGVFYVKRLPFLHFHGGKDGTRWADCRNGKSWGPRLSIDAPSTAATRARFLEALRLYHAGTLAAVAPARRAPAAPPGRAASSAGKADLWTCGRCHREFGRPGQSHTCLPALSVDDTFARHPASQRAIYDAVIDLLQTLGPVHEDAVQVGVFLKRSLKFAELRPRTRWLSLDLVLPRRVHNDRVSRTIELARGRTVHVIRLFRVADVDDRVREWLTEAYFSAS